MKITVKEVGIDYHAWDSYLLEQSELSLFLQSNFWAKFSVTSNLGKPLCLLAEQDGIVLGQMLAIDKDISQKNGSLMERIPYVFRRLEINQGPVIFDINNHEIVINCFLDWIDDYKNKNKIGEIIFNSYALRYESARNIFKSRKYRARDWATYCVDLACSHDELFAKIDHAARKGIKKARRQSIVIRKLETWKEFEALYLLPYIKLKKNVSDVYDQHKKLWREPGFSEYYSFFICEDHEGHLMGMLGLYIFSGVATEIASAVMPLALEMKVPVQDILHWETMIFSKDKGCYLFDLAGVSPSPKTEKEKNILRFKKKWGGYYLEYPIVSWQHKLVVLAKSVNKIIKFFLKIEPQKQLSKVIFPGA